MALRTFTSLSFPLHALPSGVLPHELYPFHTQVEHANTARLATLPWVVRAFVACDTGTHQKVLERMVAPTQLALKADARAMLAKNVDERLVNGSVGRVPRFFMVTACAASILASTT